MPRPRKWTTEEDEAVIKAIVSDEVLSQTVGRTVGRTVRAIQVRRSVIGKPKDTGDPFACTACHAAVGLGVKRSAFLLGRAHNSVARIRRVRGIKTSDLAASAMADQSRMDRLWKQYEEAWMSELNPRFPDWSRHHYATYRQDNLRNRKAYEKIKARPDLHLKKSLRRRYRKIITANKADKRGSVLSLLGCTVAQLKEHLQSQFDRNMTWDNYGSYWHLDHYIPCASFDHNDPEQVARCWHYSNLRPLEAKANISKGSRLPTIHEAA
jgi:hypothetical protein